MDVVAGRQAVAQPGEDGPLVPLDGGRCRQNSLPAGAADAERGDPVHRGGDPGQLSEGQGPELEALRHVLCTRQQLVRMQRLEQGRVGGRQGEVRAIPLVRGAGVEVGSQRGHVDRPVRGGVHAVHVYKSADRMRQVGDPAHVGPGPDRVAGGRDRHQPGPLSDQVLVLVQRQLAGLRVDVGPAQRRPGGCRGGDPRPDVGVVVQPADEHLVAGSPGLRQGSGEQVGVRGHRLPEEDPARVHPQQVAGCQPGGRDDRVGPHAAGEGAVAVGHRTAKSVGHRVADRGWHLRAAGAVQVRQPLGERGELRADALDVVGHPVTLPHPVAVPPGGAGLSA